MSVCLAVPPLIPKVLSPLIPNPGVCVIVTAVSTGSGQGEVQRMRVCVSSYAGDINKLGDEAVLRLVGSGGSSSSRVSPPHCTSCWRHSLCTRNVISEVVLIPSLAVLSSSGDGSSSRRRAEKNARLSKGRESDGEGRSSRPDRGTPI